MNVQQIKQLLALLRFEWEKRYVFPILELILVIFFIMFPFIQLNIDFGSFGIQPEVALENSRNYMLSCLLHTDSNFLFFAIIISFFVSISLGSEFDSNIITTTMLQAQISRKTYLKGKLILDLLMLIGLSFLCLIIIRVFSVHHLASNISLGFSLFFITKIILCYSLATFIGIWQRQMIKSFIFSLMPWVILPLVIEFVDLKEPLVYVFQIMVLTEKSIAEVNSILILISIIFMTISCLLILFSYWLFSEIDILKEL